MLRHLRVVEMRKVHLVGVLVCVLPYQEEEDLKPVCVEALRSLPLVHVDHPTTTRCIPLVLPVWKDPLLREYGYEIIVSGRTNTLKRLQSEPNGSLLGVSM